MRPDGLLLLLILAMAARGRAASAGSSSAGSSASPAAGSFAACLPPGVAPWAQLIQQRAADFGIPPEILAAVVQQESHGDANDSHPDPGNIAYWQANPPSWWPAAQALGWTITDLGTSFGLAQVEGATAWSLGAHYAPSMLYQPYLNLGLAAKYLAAQIATFGNWYDALEAYNEGATNVNRGVPDGEYANPVLATYNAILACEGAQ